MITEDYVSFETAKFLKEKGFDEPAGFVYSENGELMKLSDFGVRYLLNSECDDYPHWQFPFEGVSSIVSAPTLQMAMKWLREVHSLVIEPYRTACGYLYTVSNIPYGSTKYNNGDAYNGDDENSGQWTTWEKACEDGIKYCLENLI